MISKFLCWLGFHDWLIHTVEPINDGIHKSKLNAGCARCDCLLTQKIKTS